MRLIRLLKTDMLNIVRDRSLVVIFFLPFIILALLRIAPPLYEPLLPEMILFRPLLLAMFCLVVSALAGFLMAFILLDEKDLQLQPVFRVMPFPYSRLIALRTFFILCLGFIFCLVLILWSHLIDLTVLQALVLAFCCSLAGPTATLLLVLLAQNKIEGVTYFKLFNVILAMPIAGLFLAQPYSHLFGVIPFYWIYCAFMHVEEASHFFVMGSTGLLYNGLFLLLCFKYFCQKMESNG